MGCCLSSDSSDYSSRSGHGHRRKPCAYVVSVNGQLHEYSVPITVAEVLQLESSSADTFFICNSDRLYFEDYIPALEHHEEFQPAQIYFVLPTSKLQYRLAASDMAALAVKASVALEQINRQSRNRKTRISPVLMAEEDYESNYQVNQTKISSSGYNYNNSNKEGTKLQAATVGPGVSRSGSMMKLSRYSSKRAKLAVRSFRIKLNTIYEGSVTILS